jgi:hypothetical protein
MSLIAAATLLAVAILKLPSVSKNETKPSTKKPCILTIITFN